MIIGEYSPRLRFGEYSPIITSPSANNCYMSTINICPLLCPHLSSERIVCIVAVIITYTISYVC
jgi:hypothetical protein